MSNVGGCIIASVNSNLSPPGGKKVRDRIVDRVEFSGQLFMSNANGRDAFSVDRAPTSYRAYITCVLARDL